MKKNCLIVFGSPSPEYYVNCDMAASIIENVDKDKYNVYSVGITKEGMWFLTDAAPSLIKDGKEWLKLKNKRAIISPEKSKTLLIFDKDNVEEVNIDVVFIPIAGEYGEDGKLPALFEMAGIPIVGSGSIASCCSLEKSITRMYADALKLKQPKCVLFDRKKYVLNKDKYIGEINKIGYPIFVKPSLTGSSIGISKVINSETLEKAIDYAFEFGDVVLAEEGIENFSEIKVAVYGNGDELTCGSIMKLTADNEGDAFNTYETKYSNTAPKSKKELPAKISKELENEIITASKEIFNALNCRDYARVDFFLTNDGVLYFNEINTNPGFTDHSIYPLMIMDTGKTYKDVVNGLLQMAIDRQNK